MKKILFSSFAFSALLQIGCSQEAPCSNQKIDSAWKEVGLVPAPKFAEVESVFLNNGIDALRDSYGSPHQNFGSSGDILWVFEKRREFIEKKCDPVLQNVTITQVFVLITVSKKSDGVHCTYQTKEFISDIALNTEQAISEPQTPIGTPPRSCGNDLVMR